MYTKQTEYHESGGPTGLGQSGQSEEAGAQKGTTVPLLTKKADSFFKWQNGIQLLKKKKCVREVLQENTRKGLIISSSTPLSSSCICITSSQVLAILGTPVPGAMYQAHGRRLINVSWIHLTTQLFSWFYWPLRSVKSFSLFPIFRNAWKTSTKLRPWHFINAPEPRTPRRRYTH